MTSDTWFLTHDPWWWEDVNILSKFQLHTSYGLVVAGDMWHLTPDMWHVTHDTWHVALCRRWTFSQNFSLPALTFWEKWCFEDLKDKVPVSLLISDEGVCRTAPGLLKMMGSSLAAGSLVGQAVNGRALLVHVLNQGTTVSPLSAKNLKIGLPNFFCLSRM